MLTIMMAVVVFLLAVLGLGLGFVFGRDQIKGSCGGCVRCLGKRQSK